MFYFKKISNTLNIKNFLFTLLFFFSAKTGYACNYFLCEEIQFQGLHHVSLLEAKQYLTFHEHCVISNDEIDKSVKRMYDSHKFKSIKFVQENEVVRFVVEEFPILSEIDISGNDSLPKEAIIGILHNLGIDENAFFDQSKLLLFKKKLSLIYSNLLRNNVDILHFISKSSSLKVNLKILISENELASIKSIHFSGNKEISSEIISSVFSCYERSFFFGKYIKKNYSYKDLRQDLQNLYHLYNSQGYLDFNIFNTKLKYSKDNKEVEINIQIDEGEQYYITGISIAEQYPFLFKKEHDAFIQENINKLYNIDNIIFIQQVLMQKLLENGYMNAKISIFPAIDSVHKTVQFIFSVDKAEKCFLNKINIKGNVSIKTSDLMKDFFQKEHSVINQKDVIHDLEYLKNTNFFESVEFVFTPSSENNKNSFDLTYYVKEKKSNSFNFGFGYSPKQKLNYHFQATNTHMLGVGNTLSINFSKSFNQNFIKIFYTNPRFIKNGYTVHINFFLNTINQNFNVSQKNFFDPKKNFFQNMFQIIKNYFSFYNKKDSLMLNYGVNQSLDIQLSPKIVLSTSLEYMHNEEDSIKNQILNKKFSENALLFKNLSCQYKENAIDYLKFNSTFSFQELMKDSFFNLGSSAIFSVDYIFPLKNKNSSIKIICDIKKYIPLSIKNSNIIFLFHSYSGYKFLQKDELNNYDDFYANNHCCVRGYSLASLGPKAINSVNDKNNISSLNAFKTNNKNINNYQKIISNTIGGDLFSINSIELISPIPFINSKYLDSFRVSAFMDCGNIWKTQFFKKDKDSNNYINPRNMYFSYGVSLRWKSPFGIVSFSYALPIGTHDTKDLENFQMNIGS